MRLTHDERLGIFEACASIAGHRAFSLFLFGSRVDDAARGGDIDLLCEVSAADLSSFQLEKHRFLAAIKSRVGDQKIDLIFATPDRIASDAFLRSIRVNAVRVEQN